MALDLTDNVKDGLNPVVVEPVIILEIDGIPLLYGTGAINEPNTYDGGTGYNTPELFYDGVKGGLGSRPFVQLKGTTRNIKQQILSDKGGSGSISRAVVSIIDFDGFVSKDFRPGNYVTDVLSQKATLWVFFGTGVFPADAVKVFQGRVSQLDYSMGAVNVTISHPEESKRSEIFPIYSDELVGAIDNSQTTITVADTSTFIPSTASLLSYIRIDDEIMSVVSVDSPTQFTVTRAQLTSLPASHDDEAEVTSLYELNGNAIDLALQIMLSGSEQEIQNFQVSPNQVSVDSIKSFKEKYNIRPGDKIIVNDNFTLTVGDIFGNYFEVNEPWPIGTVDKIVIKSAYDVLPPEMGLAMDSSEVDIERHEILKTQFASGIPDYQFYIDEELTGKEFINEQIYFPAGLFSIPRDAKASVGVNSPPIVTEETKILNKNTILNWSALKVTRSTTKYFYNTCLWKFNWSILDDKFLTNIASLSADSTARISNINNKTFIVESLGLRNDLTTREQIRINQQRVLARYQFAAQQLKVETNYKTGFPIEVGDSVIVDVDKLTEPSTGRKRFGPKTMEVTNKDTALTSGKTVLTLLETIFSASVRFGLISPSSNVDVGSTLTNINLKVSYSTDGEDETHKWTDLVGAKVQVREADFSAYEVGIIDAVIDGSTLQVSGLTITPTENMVVEFPEYTEGDSISRNGYCFINPSDTVSSAATRIEVDPTTLVLFFSGSSVKFYSQDKAQVNIETVVVEDIEGTTLFLTKATEFDLINGDYIEGIGFVLDSGNPYSIG